MMNKKDQETLIENLKNLKIALTSLRSQVEDLEMWSRTRVEE